MESKNSHPSKIVAVLTGDLVQSQKAHISAVDAAMQQLSLTARDVSGETGADTRFTRFRGDGWQMVLTNPAWVLRACLIVIADLRAAGIGIETRISVGLGPYENLGTVNLSDANGQAFFLSGHNLDRMPRQRRLSIAGGPERDGIWQRSIFDLVEWQSSHWTKPQAEAMALALRSGWHTHQDLADRLGITRQAIQLRLAGAGLSALAQPLAAFENLEWTSDHA